MALHAALKAKLDYVYQRLLYFLDLKACCYRNCDMYWLPHLDVVWVSLDFLSAFKRSNRSIMALHAALKAKLDYVYQKLLYFLDLKAYCYKNGDMYWLPHLDFCLGIIGFFMCFWKEQREHHGTSCCYKSNYVHQNLINFWT